MDPVETETIDDAADVRSLWDRLQAVPLFRLSQLRAVAPFLSSMAIHAVLFLILAAWVLPIIRSGMDVPSISATFDPKTDNTSESLESSFDVAAVSTASQKLSHTSVQSTTLRNPSAPTTPATLPKRRETRILEPSVPGTSRMSEEDLNEELPILMAAMPMHKHRGMTRIKEAQNTTSIAGSLTGDLRSMSKDGDAMVVWMMDQSVSMQLDRQALASQLYDTLAEIEADKNTNVQHYVVAFGDKVSLVQNATDRAKRVTSAIGRLPVDPSGIENTFQSVEWCIDNLFHAKRWSYGKQRQRQKLLVIWTDESGDDYLNLERIVHRCRQSFVRVDIIGPSAVLGAQTGFSAWRHTDGLTYYLPVHRGPDSSFPQKLSLGYWHRGVPRNYNESLRGPYQGLSPKWHGGSNMEAMLCAFSPYALTRLSRETGGRYIIYDRPGDRPPFSLEQVQEYQPDYRSLAEIGFEMQRQPLRQLVLAASAITWQSPNTRMSQPLTSFRPVAAGQDGQSFRTQTLPLRLQQPVAQAFRTASDVERALAIFANAATTPGFKPRQAYEQEDDDKTNRKDRNTAADMKRRPAAGEDGLDLTEVETEVDESLLEQLYRDEPSKRWRAWCDLNMGRLLAVSVRLREYLTVTDNLLRNRNQLNGNTNFVSLAPAAVLQGGPTSLQRAKLAKKLLDRCVELNPDTPWAVMAQHELREPLGLQVRQSYIPVPVNRPVATPSGPPPPKPVLPRL